MPKDIMQNDLKMGDTVLTILRHKLVTGTVQTMRPSLIIVLIDPPLGPRLVRMWANNVLKLDGPILTADERQKTDALDHTPS